MMIATKCLKLRDFLGKWRISREIVDHYSHVSGLFEGEVEIKLIDAKKALWHECGTLLMNGAKLQAERKYIWTQKDDDIEVSFDDGRYFHTIAQPQIDHSLHAEHYCDPDHYTVDYSFQNWPMWRATWQSKGPRKNYVMISQFERAPS